MTGSSYLGYLEGPTVDLLRPSAGRGASGPLSSLLNLGAAGFDDLVRIGNADAAIGLLAGAVEHDVGSGRRYVVEGRDLLSQFRQQVDANHVGFPAELFFESIHDGRRHHSFASGVFKEPEVQRNAASDLLLESAKGIKRRGFVGKHDPYQSGEHAGHRDGNGNQNRMSDGS